MAQIVGGVSPIMKGLGISLAWVSKSVIVVSLVTVMLLFWRGFREVGRRLERRKGKAEADDKMARRIAAGKKDMVSESTKAADD